MIRVRPAVPEDIPGLQEIARHSVTAAQWTPQAYSDFFAGGPGAGRVAMVIEEQDATGKNQVAGFLAGRPVAPNEDEWEIENVAIAGDARRRGLGSHLLGEFLNLVRSRGGKTVFLEVRASNRAARALYEKWAFVEAGVRKSYYDNPVEDALILRLSFPQPD